jgi:hypothetical protein
VFGEFVHHGVNIDPPSKLRHFSARSTAMTSCAPQSEIQRRSWCQRGDSPNTRPATSVLAFHGQHAFALGTAIALAERSMPPVAGLPAVAFSADGGRKSPELRRNSHGSFALNI